MTPTIHIRLSVEIYEALRERAFRKRKSMSAIIREAIEDYFIRKVSA